MLEKQNMTCDTAVDGAEALKAVNEKDYDVIFMDCQMPVMDGYEATAKIRALEGDKKHTTIIAMTANAMDGDKDKCIKAGIDDYLSKPVDYENMFRLIESTVKNSGKKQTEATDIYMAKSKANKEVHEIKSGVDFEAGVKRLLGDKVFYVKLLKEFSKDYLSYPHDMRKALEEGNIDVMLRMAHTLKGIAGNLSAYAIQRIATEIETVTKENHFEKYCNLLKELDEAFCFLNDFIETFTEIKDTKSTSYQKPFNPSDVGIILNKLAELVWEDNIEAENILEELKKHMGDFAFIEDMRNLTICISEFDFETAKEYVRKIADTINVKVEGVINNENN